MARGAKASIHCSPSMPISDFRLAALAAALVACAGSGGGAAEELSEVEVRGTLTGQGVECPALLGADGRLYTLAGDIGEAGPGDEICVRGRPAQMSICMQGVTIVVSEVLPAEACGD